MQEIHRNRQTYNYDIDITVDEWKEILCLPAVMNAPNILDALEKWYQAPNQTASCAELAHQYGYCHQFFSVQNRMLGEIAVNHLNRFRLIGDDGRETYWAIAWLELDKRAGKYTVQLRPELVEAIRLLKLFD